jgi:hypothetical protein
LEDATFGLEPILRKTLQLSPSVARAVRLAELYPDDDALAVLPAAEKSARVGRLTLGARTAWTRGQLIFARRS